MNGRCAVALCTALLGMLGSSPASRAATVNFSGLSSDGHAVYGSADFVLNSSADTILVTLTNTTTATLDSGELLTGIDFSLDGLTPTLSTALGVRREVDAVGAFVDTGSPQSLSWSLTAGGGGTFKLDFNPNAKDAIIGPPTLGTYSGANGSIKDNDGHNPFAAQIAQFTLSVPNLEVDTPVAVSVFRYGTTLDPATPVHMPEPAAGVMAAAFAVVLAVRRRRATS